MQAHPVGQFRSYLALHSTRLQHGQDLLQRLFRYALGGDEARQLLAGLAGAQLHQQRLRRQQSAVQRLLQAQIRRVTELFLLCAQLFHAELVSQLAQYGHERAFPGRQDDLHTRRGLFLRRLDVARIRHQEGRPARYERGAVRRQKARGVVDVPVVHQQQRVQSCTGNGLFYSHRVCHFKSLQCYSSSAYADRMISPSSIERPSLWPSR